MQNDYFNFRIWQLFLCVLFIYCVLNYATSELILNSNFYLSNYADQLTSDRINELISFNRKMQWVPYALFPFILLIKFTLLSIVILAGVYFFNYNITFRKAFKIIVFAELIPVFANLCKFVYFLIISPESVKQVQYFYPLSLLNVFDSSKINDLFIYPLQLLNAFEVVYWIVLSFGVQYYAQIGFIKSLKIVSMSYGTCLFVWVLIIIFIELQFG